MTTESVPHSATCPDCGRPITLQRSGWWAHDGLPGECWRLSLDGPWHPCDECGMGLVDPSLRRTGEAFTICDECRDEWECERDACRTCGQQVLGERDPAGRFQCYHCAETPRTAPPVTALRLFEPAPDQMPGQTRIETP